GHQVERQPAEMVWRYGSETTVPDWRKRLVCSRCGIAADGGVFIGVFFRGGAKHMAKPLPNLRTLTHEVQADLGSGRDIDKPRSRSRYTPGMNNVGYVPPGKYFQYSELHHMLSEIYN